MTIGALVSYFGYKNKNLDELVSKRFGDNRPPLFGAEAMPLGVAITRVASGQILYKAAVTLISLPLIYTVKDKPLNELVAAD